LPGTGRARYTSGMRGTRGPAARVTGARNAATVAALGLLTASVLAAAAGLAPVGVAPAGAEPARLVEGVTPEGFHSFGAASATATLTEYSDFL
jgi:hypothetical protein